MSKTSNSYSLDSKSGVWRSLKDDREFIYCDGNATEAYIAQAIDKASDLSTGSAELIQAIVDWPTKAHLSRSRSNLLRPLKDLLKGNVLEIGSGCGAITRYLGECAASVSAVEGSIQRAKITASRCRDLPNVQVYCDNISTFESDTQFDVVTLIGVLEYSRIFLEGKDPIQAMLKLCHRHLKPEGILIVAIENQLGMKYFSGANEDHGEPPYHGITDLYTTESVVTFGRQELTQQFKQSGFAHTGFLYPLPDYKLPEIVLHDAAFEESFDFLGMLHDATNDSRGNLNRVFAEELAWPVLARNGLTQDFMNSFLAVASKTSPPPIDSADRVHFFASESDKQFNKATHIRREQSGLVVRRESLFGESKDFSGKYSHVVEDEPFYAGEIYISELVRIVNRIGWTAKEIAVWAKPWLEFLMSNALRTDDGINNTKPSSEDPLLPNRFVDCTPFNVVRLPDDTLQPFALEFVAKDSLPFSFVAFRGLYISLNKRITVANSKANPRISNLILEVLKLSGFPISRKQLRIAISREIEFQEFVNTSSSQMKSSTFRSVKIAYKAMLMSKARLNMRKRRRFVILIKKVIRKSMQILRMKLNRG